MVSGSDFSREQSKPNPSLLDNPISPAERSGDAVIHPRFFIRRVCFLLPITEAQGTQGMGLAATAVWGENHLNIQFSPLFH